MSECSLSGRGQGHVSNFYIVDLENFATASRRYTGDIHNSTVVGLFVTLNSTQLNEHVRTQALTPQCPHLFNTTTYETPETMRADSVASWLSAHCLSRIASD